MCFVRATLKLWARFCLLFFAYEFSFSDVYLPVARKHLFHQRLLGTHIVRYYYHFLRVFFFEFSFLFVGLFWVLISFETRSYSGARAGSDPSACLSLSSAEVISMFCHTLHHLLNSFDCVVFSVYLFIFEINHVPTYFV